MRYDLNKGEKSNQVLSKSKLSETGQIGKIKLGKLKSFSGKTTKNRRETNLTSKTLNMASESSDLIDKPEKTILAKLKSLFSFCTGKKNETNPRLKNSYSSLRRYIKQKCKLIILLFIIYIIIFGAVVSIPFVMNHLRIISQNQTQQERLIVRIFTRLVKSLIGFSRIHIRKIQF